MIKNLVITYHSKEITSSDLSPERIKWEKAKIGKFIEEIGMLNIGWDWNGTELKIEYDLGLGGDIATYNRTELDDHITELTFWKKMTGYKTNYK